MSIVTIVTSQAPDAKPVAVNLVLSTNWQEIINVPNYEVPELVFGGSTTVEPGVGEVISPLVLCNTSANTVNVDVQVYRFDTNTNFYLIRNMPIPSYDTIPIPLNGQFLKSGDILEAKASADLAVHSTLSFTLGQSEEDDVV
jgi:hypothetical protein|tara:strand:- start:600 stop:1025 length:426 start_codon:yes stop_codon:yes gene_type:complete